MLFDADDLHNPQKVSSYILGSFLGKPIPVNEAVGKHLSYGRMSVFLSMAQANLENKQKA